MKIQRLLVAFAIVLFTLCCTAYAVTINSATVSGDQLTISGVGFTGSISVTLNGQDLTVVSSTPTQIVATVNPVPAVGSYRLTVKAGKASAFAYVAVPAISGGVWYGGSSLGSLTTTPTSIIKPAPQLSQPGNYMFIANASLQATPGGYPWASCFIQVGSTNLLSSITTLQPGTASYMNLTATGAVILTNEGTPATASLLCSDEAGSQVINVTGASLSIIQVGTLQTGP